MTMPIGTLIKNASRHEITVSAPPSTSPEHRSDALHRGRHRHRAIAGVTDGVGRRDERQARRRGHCGTGALDRARDDQRDAVGGQATHQRGDREHADAGEKCSLMADRVADASAEQQKATEGQHIRGDDPTLRGVGEV